MAAGFAVAGTWMGSHVGAGAGQGVETRAGRDAASAAAATRAASVAHSALYASMKVCGIVMPSRARAWAAGPSGKHIAMQKTVHVKSHPFWLLCSRQMPLSLVASVLSLSLDFVGPDESRAMTILESSRSCKVVTAAVFSSASAP